MGNETAEVIETVEVGEVEIPKEVEAEVNTEAIEKAEPVEIEEEADGEFIVTIGEESPPQDDEEDPALPKRLRKVIQEKEAGWKETRSENKKLKERLANYEKKPEITLGAKPVLSDFEEDYITEESAEDQFAKALDGWYVKKNQVDKQKEESAASEQAQKEVWQGKMTAYNKEKDIIRVKAPDIDDAEVMLKESLSEVFHGALLDGAKNAVTLTLGLGRNPAKLKELSSIKSASKFLMAAGAMEAQLKTSTRKATTTPEKKVVGTGSGNSTDSSLAKLEEEADKSGDRSKVIAYKQKLKQT